MEHILFICLEEAMKFENKSWVCPMVSFPLHIHLNIYSQASTNLNIAHPIGYKKKKIFKQYFIPGQEFLKLLKTVRKPPVQD